MSRRSGKWAYVDGISCVGSWEVNRNNSASQYKASCAPGGSVAVAGNINESGSIMGYGYLPPLPGDANFDFAGVASGEAGQLVNYVGDILITETTINIPVKAGTPINWTAGFGVQGELTKETSTEYEDTSRVPGASASNGKIAIESVIDSDTFTDVVVQNIQLQFRQQVSETVEDGLTYREPGNLEANISFDVETDDRDVALYACNAIKNVRAYVTPTLFYLFDAIVFGNHTGFKVDRNSNSVIGYTVTGLWTALRERTPAALGQILLPGGDTYYGEESS